MIKKIKVKVNRFLERYRYFKYIVNYYDKNRIEFQYNLSPEFVITDHADKQMNSRFKWDNEKKKKIIIKAWNSREKFKQQFFARKLKIGHKNKIYRKFSGYIFVFATRYNKILGMSQKILITAINPKLIEK